MARIIAAPGLLAVSVFGGLWLAASLTLSVESSQLLERCEATGRQAAECRLLVLGR